MQQNRHLDTASVLRCVSVQPSSLPLSASQRVLYQGYSYPFSEQHSSASASHTYLDRYLVKEGVGILYSGNLELSPGDAYQKLLVLKVTGHINFRTDSQSAYLQTEE